MKTLPLLLISLASPLAHADGDGDIASRVNSTGTGLVGFRQGCAKTHDQAKAEAIHDAVQRAILDCAGNVRQLTPFSEVNECTDHYGGDYTETATFGCLYRSADARNMILSSSYYAAPDTIGFILDSSDTGGNNVGEGSFAETAAKRCGNDQLVRVKPFHVAAKIDPDQVRGRQIEVVTTSEVLCGVTPELLKN